MSNKQRKVVRVDFGPAYIEGLFVRLVEFDDGNFRTQHWNDSDGWVDSEVTYGDFFDAREVTPEELRELGIPEE